MFAKQFNLDEINFQWDEVLKRVSGPLYYGGQQFETFLIWSIFQRCLGELNNTVYDKIVDILTESKKFQFRTPHNTEALSFSLKFQSMLFSFSFLPTNFIAFQNMCGIVKKL